jgi:hypothetical protein
MRDAATCSRNIGGEPCPESECNSTTTGRQLKRMLDKAATPVPVTLRVARFNRKLVYPQIGIV